MANQARVGSVPTSKGYQPKKLKVIANPANKARVGGKIPARFQDGILPPNPRNPNPLRDINSTVITRTGEIKQ